MKSLIQFLRSIPSRVRDLYPWFMGLSRYQKIIVAIIVIAVGIIGYKIFENSTQSATATTDSIREVTLSSVADLASARTPLPLIGTVTSVSEATIRSDSSGSITAVYKKLGDYVGAGQIIAEMENSREKAALDQADAALASAEASAGISSITGANQKQQLDQAKVNAINAISSAYDTTDDSIHSKMDPMFNNASLANPQFSILISNNQLTINLNSERLKITDILNAEGVRRAALTSDSDLTGELDKATTDLWYIKNFADDVATGLSEATANQSISQTTISGYQVTVGTARTTLNGAISTLSGAETSLTSAQAAYDISQKQSGTGGTVTTSDAALKQAEASVRLAQANLDQTIIRSPINGTINSFSLQLGDFVTAFEQVAVVSNNGALEIRAYITEDDAHEIKVGAKATIGDDIAGVVTRVAPALDPLTKKIEIRIGITDTPDKTATLTNGQSVGVSIERTALAAEVANNITVPISAIKISSDGPAVFTVENGILKSHAVVEGVLLGDRISLIGGVTPDMIIVTDARGFQDGDKVLVKQ